MKILKLTLLGILLFFAPLIVTYTIEYFFPGNNILDAQRR